MSSNRKPISIETGRRKKKNNIKLQNFFKNTNIKHFSRNKSLGAVFAGRFNRTNRDLLERPVFEKGDSNWIDILSTTTKQINTR